MATCGSLLLSHHGHVRRFGLANLVAAGGLAWLDRTAVISLWCGWAAITSIAIAWHLRRVAAEQDRLHAVAPPPMPAN